MFDVYISYSSDLSNSKVFDNIYKNTKLTNLEGESSKLLLNYIEEAQKTNINQINKIEKYSIDKFMQLDSSTRRNLEILESNREKTKKEVFFGF